jgi:hypothetical protein
MCLLLELIADIGQYGGCSSLGGGGGEKYWGFRETQLTDCCFPNFVLNLVYFLLGISPASD